MLLHALTQRLPLQLRREVGELVDALGSALPWEDAPAVPRVVALGTRALLFSQVDGHLGEVEGLVLHPALHLGQRLFRTVLHLALGVPVRQVGDTDTERLELLVVELAVHRQKVLVLQEVVETPMQQAQWPTHLFRVAELAPVGGAEGAQSD